MKKIGVITRYYGSTNYGGLLQAYALCRYLNSFNDIKAEQLCYFSDSNVITSKSVEKFKRASLGDKIKIIYKRINIKIASVETYITISNSKKKRHESIEPFRNSIPHSDTVYSDSTIEHSSELYDVFITGSDRVWNPKRLGNPYYLTFVKNRKKISYAASLASTTLTTSEKERFSIILDDFDSISVREMETVEILSSLTKKEIKWVVDPTFLLSSKEWEDVCEERYTDEKYIFCYFLGADLINRELVIEFAQKKHLRILTIPHANDVFRSQDLIFGKKQVIECSPGMFLSLIKNAEYIFTDSFHATVFSTIFQKEVFSLERGDLIGSGTRLQSLTNLLDTSDHYCNEPKKLTCEYIESLHNIDYDTSMIKLQEQILKSKKYLISNLEVE